MPSIVVDSGPLIAALDRNDPDHESCAALLQSRPERLVIPVLCIAEVAHMVGTRLGPQVESGFLHGLEAFDIEPPSSDDWGRIGDLVSQYADWPLGSVDASIVALAERLDVETIVTLDKRRFRALRPRHRAAFELLP